MRALRIRLASVLGASFLVICLGPATPLQAAPHGARIVAVIQNACGSLACTPGSEVKPGALVGGTLQIKVEAQADLGLEWVRLEAQNPGDPRWYCLEFWDAGKATTFQSSRTWNTIHWTDPRKSCAPTDCSHCVENSPHHHGAPSENLAYAIRVVAREQGAEISNTPDDESPQFTFRLQNSPQIPLWLGSPSAGRSADGRPVVTLQWAPNPEEKAVPPEPASPPAAVREYRFLRIDPSGHRTAYAVSALHPEDQGCRRVTTIAYECDDNAFPPGSGGNYRYAIAAVVGGFEGSPCELSSGTCVIGPLSAFQSVAVAGSSAPAADPGQSAAAVPTANAGRTTTIAHAPVVVPTEGLAAAPAASANKKSPPLFIAIGAFTLLGAAGGTIWRGLLKRRAS